MASLVALVDWRSPGKWSKAQLQRRCDLASISNVHERRPINSQFWKRVLVASAPAYLEVDGVAQGPFNSALAAKVKAGALDLFPDGERFEVWRSGAQRLYAINLCAQGAARTFAQLFAESFPWADGAHLDYFTNLGWLAVSEAWSTMDFWNRWDEGLKDIVAALRAARPAWVVVGQQYHLTGATAPLNGLFIEEYPTRSGMTLEKHDAEKKQLAQNGLEPVWIAEIRNPAQVPPSTLDAWKAWAEVGGYYLALGRDATAVGK